MLASDWLLNGSLRANALVDVKRLARSEWSGFFGSLLIPLCWREFTPFYSVPPVHIMTYEMSLIKLMKNMKIYE